MTNKCLYHQISHEFICYQCNCLMCSKCVTSHYKDHPGHADKVDKIESKSSSINTTTTNNNDNKQSYIFITHQLKGATLINTSNNYSVEHLQLDYQFINTYSAIVSIGEYIYIFGGLTNENKWIKISMKSKSIEHIGDIEGIEGDYFISVCYDGQDHIYLVNGANNKNRIDRFNIKTMKFESYHQLIIGYGWQVSSMIFKGLLYSISFDQNKLFQFDLTNRTITDHQIDITPYSACHDNNGNFFILDRTNKRFIKYNVETKQTIYLKAIPLTNGEYSCVKSNGRAAGTVRSMNGLFVLCMRDLIIANPICCCYGGDDVLNIFGEE
ncbi:hypothetical protein PPL_04986 [Heterostelium album PN500]|uniref:B box-type domain-containing protein n=1 Tax=Heterostelium pallidum (strain ATCC 26659 / Pp 5 / PN500) TaxID=670386 RepID=D3B942_HETP5|nr:hypothetical protein PPL_04986 [Heterostelium album PN500]EFA82081.1 hypothetical protein PPL_04986 [Heterostelium album PN500]|eukprot:XP_020434198.1 hypothetical protein PPL_04986 [Heterostelium album PN500]